MGGNETTRERHLVRRYGLSGLLCVLLLPASARAITVPPTVQVDAIGEASRLNGLHSVACATTAECVATAEVGWSVTFNPAAPSAAAVARYNPYGTEGYVACPTATQCSAVDLAGIETTFNPVAVTGEGSFGLGTDFSGISCPTASQCTGVEYHGYSITFDPNTPGTNHRFPIDRPTNQMGRVACPSATLCVAADSVPQQLKGNLVIFNPINGHVTRTPVIGLTPDAVSCPTARSCTVAGSTSFEHGGEVTFDPTRPGKPTLIKLSSGSSDLSCPTTTQCTQVGVGIEITFRPGVAGTSTQQRVFPGGGLTQTPGIACPTTTQCTVVGEKGQEVTFNPGPPKPPPPTPRRRKHHH